MKHKKRSSLRNALLGALLGLGAPLGYLFYSFFLFNIESLSFLLWSKEVFENQQPLLLYLTLPTIMVFAGFGFYHGCLEKRLSTATEQMDQFIHIAAHDIRSPLTVIEGGVAQLLKSETDPLNENQQESLQLVARQTEVMSGLLTELLDIHRIEEGHFHLKKKEVAIVPLVEKTVDEMRLFLERKEAQCDLIIELNREKRIQIDSFRIKQVLRNLLSNAFKHISEHGKIEVRVALTEEKQVLLSVLNDGPKIPNDKIESIFNKFIQAQIPSRHLGVGLGLSICKYIVELHGGSIWAENLTPTGVGFYVILEKN